jgi:DNA polymerase-3 subunit epsilon
VKLAMESLNDEKKTYAIVGMGRGSQEKSLVLVENGIYLGHGFTDYNQPASTFDELRDRITSYTDNHDIQKILSLHLKKPNGDEVVYF